MIITPIASGKFIVRQTMNQYLVLDPGWLFEKRSRSSPEYETMITVDFDDYGEKELLKAFSNLEEM